MGQREQIMQVAAGEVGYKEYQNNNNKYGVWYGMNNQPWCAMFVSWCAEQVGALGKNNKSGIIPKTAWVPDYQIYYSAKGLYKPKGSYTPKSGDIILYGSNSHVGLVENCANGKVVTIEGNTSANGNSSNGDGVYRRTRSLNDSWIKGYCVPEYEEGEDEVRYQKLSEVPDWGKDTVQKLINNGILSGNTNGLDLSNDMLRILVMNDRAGLYDK